METTTSTGLTMDLLSIIREISGNRRAAGLHLADVMTSLNTQSLSSSQTLEAVKSMFQARVAEGQETALIIESLALNNAVNTLDEISDRAVRTSGETFMMLYQFAANMLGSAEQVTSPDNISSLAPISARSALGLTPAGNQIDIIFNLYPSNVEGQRGSIWIQSFESNSYFSIWYDGETGLLLDRTVDGVSIGDLLMQRVKSTQAYSEFARLTELMETYGGAITSEQLLMQMDSLVSEEARAFITSVTNRTRSLSRDGFLSVLSKYFEDITPQPNADGEVLGAKPMAIVSSLANVAGTILTVTATIAVTVLVACNAAIGAAVSAILSVVNSIILRVKEETTFSPPVINGYPTMYHVRDVFENPLVIPASRLSESIKAAAKARGVTELVTPLFTLLIYYNTATDQYSAQTHLNVCPIQDFIPFLAWDNTPGVVNRNGETITSVGSHVSSYKLHWQNTLSNVTAGPDNTKFSSFSSPNEAMAYDVPTSFAFSFIRYVYFAIRGALQKYQGLLGATYGFHLPDIPTSWELTVADSNLRNVGWSYACKAALDALANIESDTDLDIIDYVESHKLRIYHSTDHTTPVSYDPSLVMTEDEYRTFTILCIAMANVQRMAWAIHNGWEFGDRDYSDGVRLQRAFIGLKHAAELFSLNRRAVDFITRPWSEYSGTVQDLNAAANTAPVSPEYNPDDLETQYDVPNVNLATVRNALVFTGVALATVATVSMVASMRITRWKRSASVRNDATLEVARAKLSRGEISQDQYQQVLSRYNKTNRRLNAIYGLVSGASSGDNSSAGTAGAMAGAFKSVQTFAVDNSDAIAETLSDYGIDIPSAFLPDGSQATQDVTLSSIYESITGSRYPSNIAYKRHKTPDTVVSAARAGVPYHACYPKVSFS